MKQHKVNAVSLAIDALPLVYGVLLCLFVLVIATDVSSSLRAPVESDFFRDMGAAQSINDGGGFADPAYKGEVRWYNPLAPAVMAMLSRFADVALPVLYTQWGAYLNLLVPLFFFLLVTLIFGAWSGLAALVAFLFLGQLDQEVWHQATYTPWFWPMEFVQSIAYAALIALWFSLQTGRLVWHLLCGTLLGVTMLGHSAPALIISSMVVVFTVIGILSGESTRQHWVRLLVVAGVSLLVSLPFLLPILEQYQFKVVNEAPMQHVFLYPGDVLRGLLTMRGAVAASGLFLLLFLWKRSSVSVMQRRFVLVWLGVVAVFFLYGLVAIFIRPRLGVSLPKFVPTFHFSIYFKAAESLLFGVGLVLLFDLLLQNLRKYFVFDVTVYRNTVVLAVLTLLIVVRLPDYRQRHDLTHYNVQSNKYAEETGLQQLYNNVLHKLEPDEVVLANNRIGLQAVIAAGRKVVVIDPVYSNPYVDYTKRASDRKRMFSALRAGRQAQFFSLADEYSVGYVAVENRDNALSSLSCCWLPAEMDNKLLELIFETDGVRLYRVSYD